MRQWRQLKVGDPVWCSYLDPEVGPAFAAVVVEVPERFRDASGSHATTSMFNPPKVWIVEDGMGDLDPVPWTVNLVEHRP